MSIAADSADSPRVVYYVAALKKLEDRITDKLESGCGKTNTKSP